MSGCGTIEISRRETCSARLDSDHHDLITQCTGYLMVGVYPRKRFRVTPGDRPLEPRRDTLVPREGMCYPTALQ